MDRSVRESIAGGTWIFLGGISNSIAGIVFWLVLTNMLGVESIGVASSVLSAAIIASTLVSAGINFAVMREIAARGKPSFLSSLVLGTIMAFIAGVLSYPLIRMLGYSDLVIVGCLLGFFMTLNIVVSFSLLGFQLFREYFYSMLGASITKIAVGVILAILGYKFIAPLAGYLASPIIVVFAGLTIVFLYYGIKDYNISGRDVKNILSLSLSNYPFVFSNQLLSMLSVYLFAYIIGKPISTGTLYMAMMISLSMASIPVSILSASLPIATRRNTDPFGEGLRIGLGLATILIVFVAMAPEFLLKIINKDLEQGANTLRIMIASLTPFIIITAGISKMNKERMIRQITFIGIVRFMVLLFSLIPLARLFNADGAAMSFLLANLLSLPFVIGKLGGGIRESIFSWVLHLIAIMIGLVNPYSHVVLGIFASIATVFILHYTRALTLEEIKGVFKVVLETL